MLIRSCQFLGAVLLLAALPLIASAQPDAPEESDEFSGGLALPSVAAAEIDSARAALDAGDAERAAQILQPLLDEDPQLHEARGLLGIAKLMQGDLTGGRALIDALPDVPASFPAVGRTVSVLEETDIDRALIVPYRERAMKLARLAADEQADNPAPYLFIATMASRLDDWPEMRRATEVLIARFPEQEQGHFLAARIAVHDEDWDKYELELREAERLGMPAEIIAEARSEAARTRAAKEGRSIRWSIIAASLLAVVLAVLFVRRIARPSRGPSDGKSN